jgi:hypothetical protein
VAGVAGVRQGGDDHVGLGEEGVQLVGGRHARGAGGGQLGAAADAEDAHVEGGGDAGQARADRAEAGDQHGLAGQLGEAVGRRLVPDALALGRPGVGQAAAEREDVGEDLLDHDGGGDAGCAGQEEVALDGLGAVDQPLGAGVPLLEPAQGGQREEAVERRPAGGDLDALVGAGRAIGVEPDEQVAAGGGLADAGELLAGHDGRIDRQVDRAGRGPRGGRANRRALDCHGGREWWAARFSASRSAASARQSTQV